MGAVTLGAVIVFAVLLGVAMTLAGEAGRDLMRVFESANAVIMKLVFLLMEVAPYGIFCLIAKVFAEQGPEAFKKLAVYFRHHFGILNTELFADSTKCKNKR